MNRATILTVIVVAASVAGGVAYYSYLKPSGKLGDYLPELYQAYDVPRADMGPGTVFVGEIEGSSVAIEKVICSKLYLAMEPELHEVPVSLANTLINSDIFAEAGLNFLERVTKGNVVLQLHEGSSANVKWGQTFEVSYYAEDGYLKDGTPRPISRPCRERISQFESIDADRKGIFIIVGTIAARGLIFTTERTVGVTDGTSFAVPVFEGVESSASLNIKVSAEYGTTLSFSDLLHIGYKKPWRINEWRPTGQTSGLIIKVKGSPTNLTIKGLSE